MYFVFAHVHPDRVRRIFCREQSRLNLVTLLFECNKGWLSLVLQPVPIVPVVQPLRSVQAVAVSRTTVVSSNVIAESMQLVAGFAAREDNRRKRKQTVLSDSRLDLSLAGEAGEVIISPCLFLR